MKGNACCELGIREFMLTSITVFPSIPRRTATLVTPRGILAGALLTGSVTAFGGCGTTHFADNVF